jgi:hypothetical protein
MSTALTTRSTREISQSLVGGMGSVIGISNDDIKIEGIVGR